MSEVHIHDFVAVSEGTGHGVIYSVGHAYDLIVRESAPCSDVYPPYHLGIRIVTSDAVHHFVIYPAVIQQEVSASVENGQRLTYCFFAFVSYAGIYKFDDAVFGRDGFSEQIEGEYEVGSGCCAF